MREVHLTVSVSEKDGTDYQSESFELLVIHQKGTSEILDNLIDRNSGFEDFINKNWGVKVKPMSEEIRIEDTEDCEYDCDEEECIATGCERYGKCVFTIDSDE